MKFLFACLLVGLALLALAWQQGALDFILNGLDTGKTGATIRAF